MSETCDVSLANIPDAAFVSKKCFMADRGFGGTVFSTGNAVIVQINGDEHVAKIHHFLSLRVPLNHELTSVKLLV